LAKRLSMTKLVFHSGKRVSEFNLPNKEKRYCLHGKMERQKYIFQDLSIFFMIPLVTPSNIYTKRTIITDYEQRAVFDSYGYLVTQIYYFDITLAISLFMLSALVCVIILRYLNMKERFMKFKASIYNVCNVESMRVLQNNAHESDFVDGCLNFMILLTLLLYLALLLTWKVDFFPFVTFGSIEHWTVNI